MGCDYNSYRSHIDGVHAVYAIPMNNISDKVCANYYLHLTLCSRDKRCCRAECWKYFHFYNLRCDSIWKRNFQTHSAQSCRMNALLYTMKEFTTHLGCFCLHICVCVCIIKIHCQVHLALRLMLLCCIIHFCTCWKKFVFLRTSANLHQLGVCP